MMILLALPVIDIDIIQKHIITIPIKKYFNKYNKKKCNLPRESLKDVLRPH